MKIDKYDRQVRIWGTKGQKKLSFAKIAVLGCCGASIQAAKNLILPGIGRVDILDNKNIKTQDLATSFFYTHESVGKLRGEEASLNLLQMNPDVQGQFKNVSIEEICQSPKQWLQGYDLAICGNLSEQQNKRVSGICWQLKLPVIFITSVGFMFHIRSQKQLHIVESENISGKKYYMRLHEPFQGLQQYARQKQLSQLICKLKQNQNNNQIKQLLQKEFSKITYTVFLIESYKQLKQSLGRKPQSQQVKQLLTQWKQLVKEDPDIRNGINQALTRSFDLYQPYDNFLPSLDIFQDQSINQATNQSNFIYIFLKAVKQFMSRNNNILPQIVRLPDISTSTKDYLEFKSLYKVEHDKHVKQLKQIINGWWPDYLIDQQLLGEYINNIDALKIVKMKPYYQQLNNPDTITTSLNYLGDNKNLLIALRSYKIFQQQFKKAPTKADEQKIIQIGKELSEKWQLTDIDQRYLRQICRYEGKSLISYDSMAGAITGQQAVKLITQCFTPLNNGYFFDGLHCKGYSITL